jgi:uncharacterized membrane protein
MDTLQRSLTKTVVWRIIATVITLVVTYLFTGELKQATSITLVIAMVLMVGYYINERVWDSVEWGRKQQALATQNAKSQRARRVVR